MRSKKAEVDALIDAYRKRGLALAERVGKTNGATLSEDLDKRLNSGAGSLKNDTSPNLKKLMKTPGAFFSKRKVPIPLGKSK